MPISVAEYLAGEQHSPIRHEFIDGVVYAMAGATNVHNEIAGNIFAALKARLRGGPCRPFIFDTKVRLTESGTSFYYPDVLVTCRPNPPEDTFQDQPVIIFEVLSPATKRIDEGEKKKAYLARSSVSVYAVVESNAAAVILYRRVGAEFKREAYEGIDASLAFPEVGANLPLAEIYENIAFGPATEP